MRKPSYTVPIMIGVLAVGGLVGMNVISLRNAPKTEAQLAAEAEEEAAKAAKSATPDPNVAAPATVGDSDDLVMTDGAVTYGPKDSTKKIVVGYEWSPVIQSDPGKIEEIAGLLKRAAPDASVTLVNVDEDPSVPTGIVIGGKVVAPLGPDGTVSSTQIPNVMQAISGPKKK